MSEYIKRYKLEVEIQDNGLIRDPFGWIIGCCHDEWFNAVVRHKLPEQPERTCQKVESDDPPCSVCGHPLAKHYSFCPNCGAEVVE